MIQGWCVNPQPECRNDRYWSAAWRVQFFNNAEQHINHRMKIYKAKPRRCRKIHSGSIANVPVIKVLLVLPKVISLAARSHLARDGIRGLLWALSAIYPRIRSVLFCCFFRSCLLQVTCHVFIDININIYICLDIHVYIQAIYIKALGSFLDEKPQYFPSVLNHTLSRQPEAALPNFTALLLAPSSSASQRLLTIYGKKTVH